MQIHIIIGQMVATGALNPDEKDAWEEHTPESLYRELRRICPKFDIPVNAIRKEMGTGKNTVVCVRNESREHDIYFQHSEDMIFAPVAVFNKH